MPVITRTVLFVAFAAALAACAASNPGGTTPSTGSQPMLSSPADGGHEVFRPLAIHPNAGARAFLMNFVANGPNQGGVPCINCVKGASTSDNIGMTGPSSYVLSGRYWQYTISYTDISYVGDCKLAWDIASGKKTIDKFSKTIHLTSAGGFVLYAIARPRPKYSGSATLTGTVTCGKDTQSASAPLEFQ
ncbi:MAG TPA: hypothetical protein VIW73_06950 [Candidatus Cybelea sp.]